MSYHLKTNSGDNISLRRILPDDSIGIVLAFIDILSPLVRPLALDLWLAYQLPGLPYLDHNVFPPCSQRHLRQTRVPADVAINTHCESPKVTSYPVLTFNHISSWLGEALSSCAEPPDHRITINALEAFYTRSRLYSPAIHSNGLDIYDGKCKLRIPVELHSDELWVYAPIENLLLYPPIFFKLTCEYGWLRASIRITWNGLWTAPDTLEHQFLQQALKQLIEQGWQIDNMLPSSFDL